MQQRELRELYRGASGGRATLERYGLEHMHDLAKRGGRATLERYGLEHMHDLAKRGGKARAAKKYTQPATVQHWDGTIYRRVPYRSARRRARHPLLVYIEQD